MAISLDNSSLTRERELRRSFEQHSPESHLLFLPVRSRSVGGFSGKPVLTFKPSEISSLSLYRYLRPRTLLHHAKLRRQSTSMDDLLANSSILLKFFLVSGRQMISDEQRKPDPPHLVNLTEFVYQRLSLHNASHSLGDVLNTLYAAFRLGFSWFSNLLRLE
jgi:hypothetical protein